MEVWVQIGYHCIADSGIEQSSEETDASRLVSEHGKKQARKCAKPSKDDDEMESMGDQTSSKEEDELDEYLDDNLPKWKKSDNCDELQCIIMYLDPECLSAYPADAQKSLQVAKAHICILITVEDAFLKDGTMLCTLINKAVNQANISCILDSLPVVTLTEGVLKMLTGEPAHFQGSVKTSARMVVKKLYQFADKTHWPNAASIKMFIHQLTNEWKNFLFVCFNPANILYILQEWEDGTQTMQLFAGLPYWKDYLWIIQCIERFDQALHAKEQNVWKDLVTNLTKDIGTSSCEPQLGSASRKNRMDLRQDMWRMGHMGFVKLGILDQMEGVRTFHP
ncbi:hypothetical protein DACRYDRAFT_15561 [Dacryopinax primogenitus]|uniref:DUF6532 domain-containing protein n=1 Tax=Dacryopinax primogenitus (strain DJM 731) TaxID=1858805 RepID=M5G1V8_DACPD|nr:uncharacterized protein DACRYDRAFT_15561 [Dacryopinax primogenitus]EJU02195.1 hypothetical protein DACRYDRAFT_15561 [Dacryopinax primogenitus]